MQVSLSLDSLQELDWAFRVKSCGSEVLKFCLVVKPGLFVVIFFSGFLKHESQMYKIYVKLLWGVKQNPAGQSGHWS